MKHCTVLSGWNVRTRLLAALVWLAGLTVLRHISTAWILAAIVALCVAADRGMFLREAGHRMLHALPFIGFMMVTLSLSGGIPLQQDAVEFAGLLCSRVFAAVLILFAMTGGSDADGFIRSLATLPIPPGLLSLLFLVNRYIHLLTREFRQQSMALRSRMFVPKANPAVLKNLGYVIGGMFIRAYDRSEQVYAAMQARCFSGVIPYDEAKSVRARDVAGLTLAVLIFASIAILERMITA